MRKEGRMEGAVVGDTFVHLHCHTEFSMLDGAARVHDLFKGAERMGMSALAITDHGNLYGAYEFYKASKNYDVKPIIGLEAYLTPRTHRTERKRVQFGDGTGDDVASKGAYTHMTMWTSDKQAMHNLFMLEFIGTKNLHNKKIAIIGADEAAKAAAYVIWELKGKG